MSFLLPQVLWALPAVMLPLIIHFLSKRNTRVVNFSTLRFLRQMEHESIRRLRWHQWLLILLRTLILLVLISLLARPVVRGYFKGLLADAGSTFTTIIVDDSFSMSGSAPVRTGQIDEKLRYLSDILQNLNEQGRIWVLRTSDGTAIFKGKVTDLPEPEGILAQCTPGFQADHFEVVVDSIFSTNFQRTARLFANRELFIISDFQSHQRQAFTELLADTAFWNDWHYFLLPLPSPDDNIAVIDAKVSTSIPLPGELMAVTVTLLNTGKSHIQKAPVQIVLNEVRSGQLILDLDPFERKTVQFQVSPLKVGHQQGYIEVRRDSRPGDNRYYFHTYIPENIAIVLINSLGEQISFLGTALAALEREIPQVSLEQITTEDPSWKPHETDVVILNELFTMTPILRKQLEEFLEGGGNVILLPGGQPLEYQVYEALQQWFDLPKSDTTSLKIMDFAVLDRKTVQTSILRDVFEKEFELGDMTEFYRLYHLSRRAQDDIVLALKGGYPVLSRTSHRNGSIFSFAFPFHLRWSDLPIRGSFIPMLHKLIYWQAENEALSDVRIGDKPRLRLSARDAANSIVLSGPGGRVSRFIPNSRTHAVILDDLNWPGSYSVNSSGGEGRRAGSTVLGEFVVNISASELTSSSLEASALRALFPRERTHLIPANESVTDWVKEARFGKELWRSLLYVLIALVILELIFGNVYSTPKRST